MADKEDIIVYRRIETSLGQLIVASHSSDIIMCRWADAPRNGYILERIAGHLSAEIAGGSSEAIESAEQAIRQYLENGATLPEISIRLLGTPLQLSVWEALRGIPCGTTATYSSIAQAVGRPDAVRAVAAAIGMNPIEIIIPCHRVISVSGALTGYAGGIDRKRELLNLESSHHSTIL